MQKNGSSTVCAKTEQKIEENWKTDLKKSDGAYKTNLSVNAEINLKPVPTARHNKAPSLFHYAVTSQGERSVTLGISPWTRIMTATALTAFRKKQAASWWQWHIRKIIALANMSFRTGTPYPSMPVLGNVVRCLIPRVLADASPWALLCRAVGTGSRFISAYSDVEFFSCINPRVFKIEKA